MASSQGVQHWGRRIVLFVLYLRVSIARVSKGERCASSGGHYGRDRSDRAETVRVNDLRNNWTHWCRACRTSIALQLHAAVIDTVYRTDNADPYIVLNHKLCAITRCYAVAVIHKVYKNAR
jgi:hypothetical protein